MKITVNAIPPSNNEFISNSKNFNVYRRVKEEWHWLIKSAIRNKPKIPYDKAVVTITYFFADNRRRDPDNYSGKMILDPLVKEGVLADDNFNVITLNLKCGGVDKKNPRTEIEVVKA